MSLPTTNPTKTDAWIKLKAHFNDIREERMQDWFEQDSGRASKMTIQWEDFYVDYSKNRVTEKTIDLLLELAEQVNLRKAIDAYFNGAKINSTEDRAVLHTALRKPPTSSVEVEGKNVIPEIYAVRKKIETFCHNVINGNLKGYSGKTFNTVVNIGIGGSDLGPAMVVDAMTYYKNNLTTHFVSNVDGDHINETLKKLDPETTLFVIVSKTFTTQETISNATTIRNWFLESASKDDIAKHFVAVSTNIEKVKEFGILEGNIFPMWNWVGGRFSLWSAVGLSISLSIGYNNFSDMLSGANAMDEHFKNAEYKRNIPVITALLSVWYNNFFKTETEAIIPYTQYLNQFATYLQQAIMESNGKGVDRNGKTINYETGNIVWGEPGTNSQHAFFQLIHQGTKLIPTDFIGFMESLHGNEEHHDKLMANYFAQTEALLMGRTKSKVQEDGAAENVVPFKIFEGNRPTTTILIKKLTPESLGKLIAMYEHKIFVQGVIWNIFSYDQFGVELGKQLAGTILSEINGGSIEEQHDASTTALLNFYLQNKD